MAQRGRRPKDEIKHDAILKAATKLFLRHGYALTSMENIADAAGVTKQTVYSHFISKEGLFVNMVDMLCKKHTPSPALLRDQKQPIDLLLREIGRSFLTMLTSKEGMSATRLVIAEAHNHPELAARYYNDGTQKMIAILADFLDQQQKRGTLSIANTSSAAAHFFSLLKGRYYVRMLLGVKPMPAASEKEAHVIETVNIFLKIYGNPQSSRKQ